MIRGYFNSGRPYVKGLVYFADFDQERPIQFLIDTGADITTVHPADFLPLNIDTASMGSPDRESIGIGGSAGSWSRSGIVMLPEDDSTTLSVLACDLDLAVPNETNMRYPSLLGRDVLQHFTLVVAGTRLISLEAFPYVLNTPIPDFLRPLLNGI